MAAAVFIPPSPHDPFTMPTSRPRAPLASIPNATNSPHRSLTQSIGKRPRTQGPVLQENEPPQKKQILARNSREDAPTTPRRKVPPSTAEGRVFERGSTAAHPTEFHKKLIASKKETDRPTLDTAESTIRAWQKHYRKVFPSFVFYFDSVPDEVRVKFSKQVNSFGAVSFDHSLISLCAAGCVPSKTRGDVRLTSLAARREILLQGGNTYYHNTAHTHRVTHF
jgi:regulatory subunit for Cdc7p protein kinase